ncbi:MAG: hypothetical protein AAF645_30525 [Myxococcota bacterium]
MPETTIDPPVLELALSSRRCLLIAGEGAPWPEPDGALVWRTPRYRTTAQEWNQLVDMLT